jgi:hypothetical protein
MTRYALSDPTRQWHMVCGMNGEQLNGIPRFIRRVMPTATDAELQEAADTFREYMAIVLRIYERVKQEHAGTDSPAPQS